MKTYKLESSIIYADDLVLLGSTQLKLQWALDRLNAVCVDAGMKVNVFKSEVMVISRNPVQYLIYVDGDPVKQVKKFKYLEVYFTSDGRAKTEFLTDWSGWSNNATTWTVCCIDD